MEEESFQNDAAEEQHVYPMFTTLDDLIEELGKEVGSVELEAVQKSSNIPKHLSRVQEAQYKMKLLHS